MTTRLKNTVQSVCIILILMLLPNSAYLQEQKEVPAAPQGAMPPGEAPLPAGEASASVRETGPAAAEVPTYTIKKGDTLWDISSATFRDPYLWPFLWKANPFIVNPDLIYPGNTLQIPSLTPIERALQAEPVQAEQLQEKPVPAKEAAAAVEKPVPPVEVEEVEPKKEIAAPPVGRPAAVQPASIAAEEQMPETSRLVMPEEQIYPAVDKYAMLSAGFVDDEKSGDVISGAPEKDKGIFGYDDIVYVSMRGADTINIGDKYLIIAPLQNVKHPKTGKNFGRLNKGIGVLRITDKDPSAKALTARITLSFDAIERGSMLTPYQEPTPLYHSTNKKAKDITGYILAVTDRRTINAQTDVVYLDRGSADGVEPGDRFTVYEESPKRGFPRKLVGEVLVFLVKENTATALVQKSTDTMTRGYIIEFKR